MAKASKDGAMTELMYEMKLEGMTALVHHNIEGMAKFDASDKGSDKADFEKQHVDWHLYTNAAGQTVIPTNVVKATLLAATKYMTTKPKGLMSWRGLIQDALIVMDDVILEEPWEPFSAIVTVGRAKVTRWRPRFKAWTGVTGIVAFDERLTLTVLDDLGYRAGRYTGFCDGRKIGFGRAKVSVKQV